MGIRIRNGTILNVVPTAGHRNIAFFLVPGRSEGNGGILDMRGDSSTTQRLCRR